MTALRVVGGDWGDYVRATRQRYDLLLPSMVKHRNDYYMSPQTWNAFTSECWAAACDVDQDLVTLYRRIRNRYGSDLLDGAGI